MTVTGLTIVEADDIDAARALLQLAFRGYVRAMGRHRAGPYDWLPLAIARQDVLFWNQQTGIVVLAPGTAPDRVKIEMIGLHPDLHGFGLGQAMLYTTERELIERGYDWVELYTAETMDHLRRFYSSQGYVLTHTGPNPKGDDGISRVFFEKPLTEAATKTQADTEDQRSA